MFRYDSCLDAIHNRHVNNEQFENRMEMLKVYNTIFWGTYDIMREPHA